MVENNNNQEAANNNEEQSNQQNTNSNSPNNGGGGKKIVIGIDHGGMDDKGYLTTVAKGLEDCGNEVIQTGVSPNQEGLMQGHGADLAVFLTNGIGAATYWSFRNAIKAGSLPYTIFMSEGWYHVNNDPESPMASLENARKTPYSPEHDADQFMGGENSAQRQRMKSEGGGAQTVGDFFDANSQYMGLCWAATPEEAVQQLCTGGCEGGGSGSGTVSSSGGSAQVKDKTFEHCIRRICAATDSVFLVENNAAVLFPYTDWMAFTLRHQINQIKAKDMDPDLFEINYNTDGFYNKVTVVWGADEEQDKVTKDKEDEEDKKTTGNTTTIQKTMPTGGTQLSEQYDPLVNIYGELEKKVTTNFPNEETAHYVMNALLIQYIRDFNNSCRVRAIHNNKYIGGTFYAVENPNTKKSELFYLNSYTIFKEKDQPLVTDLEFKYGPEGAEELLDYQTYGGGGGGVATDSIGSGSATEEEIWKGTQKACHQWTCAELRVGESDTNDPQVAEDYYNKNVKAGKKFCLTCYGMSAWLYYQFNYKANIPCRIIGNSEHHVVELFKNNAWYKPTSEYSKYCEEGYRYNDYLKTASPIVLDAPNPPSGSSSNANPSGNTADQNKGGNA